MWFCHPNVTRGVLAAFCLITVCGCPGGASVEQTEKQSPTAVPDTAAEPVETGGVAAGWNFVTETTGSGLTLVGNTVSQGGRQLMDSSTTAWLWSRDRSANGWKWIRDNAGDATAWARDSAAELWSVTRQESGEFSLWVRCEVADGVAWVRTTIPKAWRVTTDAAGETWVWIGEHQVEMVMAAAVVTVVVAALVTSPQAVASAAVRGALVGGSQASVRFLARVWQNSRDHVDLQRASEDLLQSIGLSVLLQTGPQILSSAPVAASGVDS